MTPNFAAPILENFDPGLQEFRFNGSIRWPSPYRGEPSPEVDAAWNRISIVPPLDLDISREDFLNIGVSPDTAATNAPEHGGGYLLVPEFTHQLHCVVSIPTSHSKLLNVNRKAEFAAQGVVFQVPLLQVP